MVNHDVLWGIYEPDYEYLGGWGRHKGIPGWGCAGQAAPARLVVLQSLDGNDWNRSDFAVASSFQNAIDQRQFDRTGDTTARRVYVLEGLNPEFIAILSAHLSIGNSIFAEQQRPTAPEVGITPLTSVLTVRDYVNLAYGELIALPPGIRDQFTLRCSVTHRQITVQRILGEFLPGATAHHRCSLWKRVYEPEKNWDCAFV